MDSIYNIIRDILNVNKSTVIVNWDTLHIILTLSIFLSFVIFISIMRLNPCQKSTWKCEDINTDKEIPRGLEADKSMFA